MVGEENNGDEGILEAKNVGVHDSMKTAKVLDWDNSGLGSHDDEDELSSLRRQIVEFKIVRS
ncbi:hypothetical protein DVH24_033438 [Malus domestica]|uniref:Uncharacterized protein n=1 Tax=Malus domestica TaxID=3750 RepID=A0A498JFN1_MALDO|nr:hypothetical protein DVH24_033438 [Malus domestica]